MWTQAEACLNYSKVDRSLLTLALLLLAVLLLYYYPVLARQADFYIGDHRSFFEPFSHFLATTWGSGQIPLWNPYVGCGQSQLAIVSPGMFYPPHWLFAVMEYSACVATQLLLHQVVAFVGTFLLVERWGWGRFPATTAGVIVSLSGYMFALASNFTLVSTAAWVPLSLYLVSVSWDDRPRCRIGALIGGSFSIAMMLLAGRPEIWVPSTLTIALFALAPLWQHRNQFGAAAKCSALSLLPVFIGALIAAPEILPAAQWARLSARTDVDYVGILSFSGNWYDFFSFVFGPAMGSIARMSNPFLHLLESRPGYLPFCANVFVGPIAVTLALVGLADPRWRWRWWMLAFLLTAIVAVAGKNLPFDACMLSAMPILSLFRYPSKLIFFLNFIIAIMAARGAYCLINDFNEMHRRLYWLASFWFLVLLFGVLVWWQQEWSWFGVKEWFAGYIGDSSTRAIAALGRSLMFGGLTAVVCFVAGSANKLSAASTMQVVLAALSRIRGGAMTSDVKGPANLTAGVAVGILLVALFGTLLVNAFCCTRIWTGHGFFEMPDLAADAVHAAYGKNILPPRMVQLTPAPAVPLSYHGPEKQASDSDDFMQLLRQWMAYNANLDFGVSSLFSYEAAPLRASEILKRTCEEHQFTDEFSDDCIARVCKASSVQFVISQVAAFDKPLRLLDPARFRVVREVAPLNLRIYEVIKPLPFAYFTNKRVVVDSDLQAVRTMLAKQPFDPWQNVLLSPIGDVAPLGAMPSADTPTQVVAAKVLSYSYNRIDLTVEAPTAGIVVVNDSYYPGWSAAVDGRSSGFWVANARFKAVPVSPGTHRLELIFDPPVLKLGFLIAGAGVLLLMIAGAIYRRQPQ